MKEYIVRVLHLKGIQYILYMYNINHWLVGCEHFELKRKMLNTLGCQLGNGVKVVAPIHFSTAFTVGDDTWIGGGFSIQGNGTVVIGKNCDFGPEVSITTGSHYIGSSDRRAGEGYNNSITIGNGCWIGNRATIINNITIGNGSVIAACSCVISDVAPNSLVAGVPAKFKKQLV